MAAAEEDKLMNKKTIPTTRGCFFLYFMILIIVHAAVVKLVDTPALGAGSRKGMRVRVSPAALEERPP